MRRSCSCTRMASPRCRCARRRSSGTSTRPRSPAATSSSTRSTAARSRCGASSSRSSRTRRASTPRRSREIQRYTKLFWINNGPYNNLTARKFVLKCTPQAFAAAAKASAQSGATFATPAGESLDAMLTRLQPMFFDASVDPIVTNKTPGAGKDILQASANNLYSGVIDGGPEGLHREERPQLAAGEARRQARRRGLQGRRPLRRRDQRHRQAPRGRDSVRQRADGQCAARARAVVSHRRRRRPRQVRHRLGAGQGVAGRHHQRLHRGLSRRARHQGRLGRPRLLRQPGEDAAHPEARRQRAVVRGPHAVGSEVSQAERSGHRRQRHRRRRRDRRLRTGDADRHQPAERPGDPREVRQQVGVAVERHRRRQSRHAGDDAERVLVVAGRSRARAEVRRLRLAS